MEDEPDAYQWLLEQITSGTMEPRSPPRRKPFFRATPRGETTKEGKAAIARFEKTIDKQQKSLKHLKELKRKPKHFTAKDYQ